MIAHKIIDAITERSKRYPLMDIPGLPDLSARSDTALLIGRAQKFDFGDLMFEKNEGGQLAPSSPLEICPSCWGSNAEACDLCGGLGAVASDREGDPLGPPCPLGKRGAVKVRPIKRPHYHRWEKRRSTSKSTPLPITTSTTSVSSGARKNTRQLNRTSRYQRYGRA